MRIELELDEKTYWVEFKDRFTRREMREWHKAQELRWPEDEDGKVPLLNPEERVAVLRGTEERMLALLCKWCSGCYLEDAEGTVFHSIETLSPEALEDFDWALLDFLFNIPVYVRAKRSQLGNVDGGLQLRTTRMR